MLTAPQECKVFTPQALAEAMVGLFPNRPGDRWLEPCVGKGVFLKALAQKGVPTSQITAVELDRHDGLDSLCAEYHSGIDFLAWSLATNARFDRIIGNPPYLSLHRAPAVVKQAALRIPRPRGGCVPLRANCWYAFLCASLRLLRPGGSLCFVLPSGWDYADYASDVREYISQGFGRLAVVRSRKSLFDAVLDGCIVLIADGYKKPCTVRVRREADSLNGIVSILLSSPHTSSTSKIQRSPSPAPIRASQSVKFGDIARVRIGIVSGDAQYFLLKESERLDLGIGLDDLLPVVTRARHLSIAWIEKKAWKHLKDADERVWLFYPRDRHAKRHDSVMRYIAAGEARNAHLRQKTRNRERWYRALLLPASDGFMSGMTTVGPWLCLNRMRGLAATNTLYSVNFHDRPPLSQRAAWGLSLMSSVVANQHGKIGRWYSEGLLKFEPRDVMSLWVPVPQRTSHVAIGTYKEAIQTLLRGDVTAARAIADAFLQGIV